MQFYCNGSSVKIQIFICNICIMASKIECLVSQADLWFLHFFIGKCGISEIKKYFAEYFALLDPACSVRITIIIFFFYFFNVNY